MKKTTHIKISSDYSSFEKEKIQCSSCPIFMDYKKIVPSEGNKNDPQVVIIGECPGADEIIHSRPFIGKAGQFLREYLRKHNFNTTNTLITNVIPCRPKDNKFPSDDNLVISCVNKWLLKELSIINPDFIILLGSQPLKYIGNKKGITKERGKLFSIKINDKEVVCIATFHPSYLLRKQYMTEGKEILDAFDKDLQTISNQIRR